MKKSKFLLGLFACAAMTLNSCSSDDDGTNGGSIAGTYDLEEVNVSEGVDFDQNGTANTDLTKESNCFDSGKMTLNADGTLQFVNSYVLVDENLGTFECASSTFSGTWLTQGQAGSTIVIEVTYADANNDNVNLILTKQGDKLTYTQLFGQYPDRNAQGGAIYTNGSVEYVFDK
ncbi:hypothetical protein [Flavobacterium sp.]|uniref:hypothetical protein n=1 Tax=Flavobacterium sp. TaxID=239 RepID=UPI001204D2E2|nr:hypothetical protein [Flavobacterium sp.]RZJ70041.1 MAG: hypothetical protein EOO49_15420 [Flavobacterium sp.]